MAAVQFTCLFLLCQLSEICMVHQAPWSCQASVWVQLLTAFGYPLPQPYVPNLFNPETSFFSLRQLLHVCGLCGQPLQLIQLRPSAHNITICLLTCSCWLSSSFWLPLAILSFTNLALLLMLSIAMYLHIPLHSPRCPLSSYVQSALTSSTLVLPRSSMAQDPPPHSVQREQELACYPSQGFHDNTPNTPTTNLSITQCTPFHDLNPIIYLKILIYIWRYLLYFFCLLRFSQSSPDTQWQSSDGDDSAHNMWQIIISPFPSHIQMTYTPTTTPSRRLKPLSTIMMTSSKTQSKLFHIGCIVLQGRATHLLAHSSAVTPVPPHSPCSPHSHLVHLFYPMPTLACIWAGLQSIWRSPNSHQVPFQLLQHGKSLAHLTTFKGLHCWGEAHLPIHGPLQILVLIVLYHLLEELQNSLHSLRHRFLEGAWTGGFYSRVLCLKSVGSTHNDNRLWIWEHKL